MEQDRPPRPGLGQNTMRLRTMETQGEVKPMLVTDEEASILIDKESEMRYALKRSSFLEYQNAAREYYKFYKGIRDRYKIPVDFGFYVDLTSNAIILYGRGVPHVMGDTEELDRKDDD